VHERGPQGYEMCPERVCLPFLCNPQSPIPKPVPVTCPLTSHSLEDINKHCLASFRAHWQCLENHNQQLFNCRAQEWKLNECVYTNLVRYQLSCPVLHAAADRNAEIGQGNPRGLGQHANPPEEIRLLLISEQRWQAVHSGAAHSLAF
jgi:hypothetical protein